jgi:DNA-binding NarL/FixJ family response regulator
MRRGAFGALRFARRKRRVRRATRSQTAHRECRVPPITVLVADDEPMLRQALADLLDDQAGVRVVAVAANALQAVALARAHRPDVALLDVRMPGGGPAAARGIRTVSPSTHILAHSAFDDPGSRTAMLTAGAEDCILKGTEASTIAARVVSCGRQTGLSAR